MWGCFPMTAQEWLDELVFPTHVGVFLSALIPRSSRSSLPHACGGVSQLGRGKALAKTSSPRMWGCFQFRTVTTNAGRVFPTHVGVFPTRI